MSDAEQGWKPKARPQSTMAQAFSTALDSVFALDSDVHHLSQTVDERKFQMMIQNRELEELQAKIRATEERLKARKSLIFDGSGSRSNATQRNGGYQSPESASPTDTVGHYSSGDEQRQHGQTRNP
ncbi:hypothetical protein BDV28DRAFT_122096 [Aspergillus coremiiformis]|uniref:Uncharacterized protein n=1 Tax=Aspergillus coremiiformis TaxID=138285 RepID=A0A5N6Z9D9_9EURO|nr:hypothetical protein BDV28DRAFT_122096 [Aspergillus coremiiformis]